MYTSSRQLVREGRGLRWNVLQAGKIEMETKLANVMVTTSATAVRAKERTERRVGDKAGISKYLAFASDSGPPQPTVLSLNGTKHREKLMRWKET